MSGRAVLVGLNHYPNPANNLKGCVNDVLQVSKLLQEAYGFDDVERIRVLTDERATTARIVDRLDWLIGGASPGDVLLFHYSGHGAQVRDRNGDELDDGLDEIICPYDLDWDNPFTDDDLGAIVRRMKPGVSLTLLLDCCHSGTGLREAPAGLPWRGRCLVPPPDIRHRAAPRIEDCGPNRRLTMRGSRLDLGLHRFGQSAARAGAVLIAGCRADQTSADAWIDGDYHGAFTYYLCRSLAELGFRPTYQELAAHLANRLRDNGYAQVPQLESEPWLVGQPALAPVSAPAV
jgi:hypothetical protein